MALSLRSRRRSRISLRYSRTSRRSSSRGQISFNGRWSSVSVRCTLQEGCTLTSCGSAVGTYFMHRVAFASRLESEVHRDRGCIRCGNGAEAALAHLPWAKCCVFLNCLQVTGPFRLLHSFLARSSSLVCRSFQRHWPLSGSCKELFAAHPGIVLK